jgi:hypothetical protein
MSRLNLPEVVPQDAVCKNWFERDKERISNSSYTDDDKSVCRMLIWTDDLKRFVSEIGENIV